MSLPTDPTHWSHDPAEIDRFLEDQLDPAVAATRRAEAQTDAVLEEQLATRGRFLVGLARAGATWRASLPERTPPGLELRVRAALARGGPLSRSHTGGWVAVAATLLVGIGAALLFGFDGADVEAMPPAVIRAAEAARAAGEGPRGCNAAVGVGPFAFPPVREGTLLVYACVQQDGETVAKLYRPEELPSVGYAAVPAPGVKPGPTIGRTDLGDQVVFDIAYGRKVHYLAVNSRWLTEQRLRTPGRESCRACHNLSRVGKKNPHNIVQRSWKLGGA